MKTGVKRKAEDKTRAAERERTEFDFQFFRFRCKKIAGRPTVCFNHHKGRCKDWNGCKIRR